MIRSAPGVAPARPDLTFLRRRTRPAPPSPPAPAPPPSPPPSSPPPPPGTGRDIGPVVPPVTSSLDLPDSDAPALPAASGPVDSAHRAAGRPARVRVAADDRVGPGQRRVLTREQPTATLTRVQSGVGTLRIEAAVSAAVGDAVFGCAYELATGESSVAQYDGNRSAPLGARRAVLRAGRERFEQVEVDLRQCRSVTRLLCYLRSSSGQPLSWGGSVIVTTHGGSRIEIPLDALPSGVVAAPVSVYQVDGELVLRRETQTPPATVRDACRAYGFERISWMDDHTPID